MSCDFDFEQSLVRFRMSGMDLRIVSENAKMRIAIMLGRVGTMNKSNNMSV